MSGTVHFNDDLYLLNVLYIPDLYIHLIFVLKLTDFLNSNLNFTSSKCIIYGTYTMKRIGAVKLHHDLYILTIPLSPKYVFSLNNIFVNNHKILSCTLWHNRLGHPSYETITKINTIFPLPNYSKKFSPCKTCFYAKHRRPSFQNNKIASLHPFDLIHMDI